LSAEENGPNSMTRDVSTTGSIPDSQREELDPELLALPDPPKTGRTVTLAVLVLAALASLLMVFALRRDVAYAFAPSFPADLGDLKTADPAGLAMLENRHVQAEGMLGAAGAILYERPFTDDTFRALPVAGRDDVWVEVRVPAGKENPRWEPPRKLSGWLVRFHAAGPRHRGLASAVAQAARRPVPENAWLLVDGEAPAKARWSMALAVLFLGFAIWNMTMIVRIVRRVR
jgi:hypothetical protein